MIARSAGVALTYCCIDSPIGELLLLGVGSRLCGLYMQQGDRPMRQDPRWTASKASFAGARRQLDQYFSGRRQRFELDLELHGTSFQRAVWAALQRIPYGQTTTYGELARRIGRPRAVRAVGLANGRNPVSVIVPCHRVIGADGTLTGYGGGLQRKRLLLDLEAQGGSATFTARKCPKNFRL